MAGLLEQGTDRASLPLDAPLKERRITTQTLLSEFANDTLFVARHGSGSTVSTTRLTPRQAEILRRLELPTPSEQLRRLLARPPE